MKCKCSEPTEVMEFNIWGACDPKLGVTLAQKNNYLGVDNFGPKYYTEILNRDIMLKKT